MIIKHETSLNTNPSLPESTQLTTLVTTIVETQGFGILRCCYSYNFENWPGNVIYAAAADGITGIVLNGGD